MGRCFFGNRRGILYAGEGEVPLADLIDRWKFEHDWKSIGPA